LGEITKWAIARREEKMNVSSNCPRSLKEYDELPGPDGHKLRVNVNQKADQAFMNELAQTDPERFARLTDVIKPKHNKPGRPKRHKTPKDIKAARRVRNQRYQAKLRVLDKTEMPSETRVNIGV
jgi:hypothetical protein